MMSVSIFLTLGLIVDRKYIKDLLRWLWLVAALLAQQALFQALQSLEFFLAYLYFMLEASLTDLPPPALDRTSSFQMKKRHMLLIRFLQSGELIPSLGFSGLFWSNFVGISSSRLNC